MNLTLSSQLTHFLSFDSLHVHGQCVILVEKLPSKNLTYASLLLTATGVVDSVEEKKEWLRRPNCLITSTHTLMSNLLVREWRCQVPAKTVPHTPMAPRYISLAYLIYFRMIMFYLLPTYVGRVWKR